MEKSELRRVLWSLCYTLSLLFLVSPGWAEEETYTAEADFTYEGYSFNGVSGVIITAYLGEDTEVKVPPTLGGQPVIAIGEGNKHDVLQEGGGGGWEPKAFCNSRAESIVFPEGLLQIQEGALAHWGLTAVHLPASLISLIGNPFAGRMDSAPITTLTLAAGNAVFSLNEWGMLMQDAGGNNATLRYWLKSAMAACVSEEVLSFPAGANIKKIGQGALIQDWNEDFYFESIIFPSGLTDIAEAAFAGRYLDPVLLPEGLLSLGTAAFSCPITLPASLTTLEGNPAVGYGCVVALAAGSSNFRYENNLLLNADKTTVYTWQNTDTQPDAPRILPDTLRAIADYAFAHCRMEEGILVLPPNLTTLGKGAFAYSYGLTGVSVPGGVQVVPKRCFASNDSSFSLRTITFAEGVKRLEENSFAMSGASSVLLPASLEYCDPQAFNGHPSWSNAENLLQEYQVAAGNPHLQAIEGVLYSADGKTLIHCPESKTSLTRIPEGVTTIGPFAFESSQLSGYLVFPASVSTIHISAFAPLGQQAPPLATIYLLAGPPTLLPPDYVRNTDPWVLLPPVLTYASNFAQDWEAVLDEDGFYGPFPTAQLDGVPAFVHIARQDGLTGPDEFYFRETLALHLSVESTDNSAGLCIRYTTNNSAVTAESAQLPPDGLLTLTGTTQVRAQAFRDTGASGPEVSARYINTKPFNSALDNDELLFYTSANMPWSVKSDFPDPFGDKTSCLQAAANVYDNNPSWLRTTVTGPGCLVFWCRGEGSSGYDYWKKFRISDNGEEIFFREGNDSFYWTKIRHQVAAGQHTITWSSERSFLNTGNGTFYLDALAWYPGEDLTFALETVEDPYLPYPFAVVKDYLGSSPDAVLPDFHKDDGAPVARLDQYAFTGARHLLSVNFSQLRIFNSANYLSDCVLLQDILYAGGPPNLLQTTRYPVLCYYPQNYDQDSGLPPEDSQSWAYYFARGYAGTQIFLPIVYPLREKVQIGRSAGEPETGRDSFTGSVLLSLTAAPGTELRYTIDGSYPTINSLSQPTLTLTQSATIYARAFCQVGEEWCPCSTVSRRTLVNLAELNPATGTTAAEITFAIDGDTDMPWRPALATTASGTQGLVAKAGPLRPGQWATLTGTFTLEQAGIFSFRKYNRYDSWHTCTFYDAAGTEINPNISQSNVGSHNWYRYSSSELPAGTYQVAWEVWVPKADSQTANDHYHSLLLTDFGIGSLPATLTLLCNPVGAGSISANGVIGTTFNQYIGQNIALQVTEGNDYLLSSWSDGYSSYTMHQRTVQIADPEEAGENANTYTANFIEAASFYLTCEPSEAGTLTYPGGGGASWRNIKVALGTKVNFSASGKAGWRFDHWSDDDDDPETEPLPYYRELTATENLRGQTLKAFFQAGFEVNSRALYPNASNPGWWSLGGGSVNGAGFYDCADDNEEVTVTLTATANENFVFLGWDDNGNREIDAGESSDSTRVLTLTRGELETNGYAFSSDALFLQTAPVTIAFWEPGDEELGTIQISSNGQTLALADFLEGGRLVVGQEVTLTAEANAGSRLRRWWHTTTTYPYSQYEYGPEYTFTVPVNGITVSADFIALQQVNISISGEIPDGCGLELRQYDEPKELDGWLDVGERMSLVAQCGEYYRASWRNAEGEELSANATYSPYVSNNPEDNVITLVFVPTYKVLVGKTPPDGGGFLSVASGLHTIDLGTPFSFSAGVYHGEYWQFIRWQENDSTDTSQTVNPEVSGTYQYTAEFQRYVRINYAKSSDYYSGSFEGSEGLSGRAGSKNFLVSDVPREINITALPDPGYRFKFWTDEVNNSDPTNPQRTLSISTADTLLSLTADFVRIWVVSIGVKPGCENWGEVLQGTMTDAVLDVGSEIQLEAQEKPGCQFVKWSDGNTEKIRTLTITSWFGNTNIWAEFTSTAEINISLKEGQQNWGCQAGVLQSDGSVLPSGNYGVGLWQTIQAIPAANHRFVGWSDGYSNPTRSIRLAEGGLELTAEFAQTFVLKVTFKTNPEILPEGIVLRNPYYYAGSKYCYFGSEYVLDVGTYDLRYYAWGDWVLPPQESLTGNLGEQFELERTFTLITEGTVTGYINPSSLVGKWRIKDTQEWLGSNTTLSLEQGSYDIEFLPVNGWLTPAGQTITINPNRHTSFTGAYSEIVPGVELTFSPSEVSEAAGPSATIATLRRVALEGNPIDLSKSLTIHLSVSEKNALILPASSILIPAGRSLTQFPVGVVDNAIQEGFLQDDEGNDIARGRIITLSGRVAMSSSCNCSGLPTNGGDEQALQADLVIWDNDSPALTVTVSPSTLPERDEPYPQALTVARNEEVPGEAVLVELSAFITDKNGVSKLDTGLDEQGNQVGTEIEFWSGGERLPFKTAGDPSVSLVTIPAGLASVKVDLVACNDGKVDGNQVVSIFADAAEYAPGSGWVMVSDLSFPDYLITNVATPDTVLESDSTHFLQVSLSNNGNMDTPVGLSVPIAIHASRSDATSEQTLLLNTQVQITAEQTLPKNSTLDLTFEVVLSNLFPADDWRFCVIANPQNTLREVSNLNNQTWSERFAVNAGYVPQLEEPPVATILPDDTLQLTGMVYKSSDSTTPVPNVPVEVYFISGEYRRMEQTTSAADGSFSIEYDPTPTEIGQIITGACYPGTQTNAKQQQFDVLGFKYNTGGTRYLKWDLTVNTAKEFTLTLSNPNAAELNGIQGEVLDAQGNPETDIQLQFSNLPETLAGLTAQSVTFQITATTASPGRDYERPTLRFTSAEGAMLDIPVYFYAIPQFASLAVSPVSLDTTMQIGVSRQIEVTLSNQGAIETGPITVTAPVLSWLTLPSGSNMPSIPAGESATITIQLKGDENTALGAPLRGAIAINADNAQNGIRLPFTATAVSEDKGSLQVTAMDEFTFNTIEKPNLANATVTVKNPYTGATLATGSSGETGICLLEDLPVGKCQIIVSADKHENNIQLADIAPGSVVKLDAFLAYQAITYSWDVVPTEIEDEYEVVLNIVYETNVPMPVVETAMPTNFLDMEPGSVRMVNAVLTNKGLINANEVRLEISNTPSFTFECSQPDNGFTLLPQQSFVVPIIVRRAAATRSADCYTRAVTVYYYECGLDRKWHRYEKKVDLTYCPGIVYGYAAAAGPGGPGVPYRDTASVVTPALPPAPSVPESCVPCQKGLLNAAFKCGIGFIPGVGCVSGIIGALGSLYHNYRNGLEGWNDIMTESALAGLGCAAEGTAGMVSNVLGCIKGFMEACDGLDGQPPVPFPYPGGFAPSPGGTRGGATRETASWMEELQNQMYWGYRQGGAHAAAIEEFYGAAVWLDCEAPQLNAFNQAFEQLSSKVAGVTPVVHRR